MIRNMMLAIGLFTLTGTSAMAATRPHARKPHTVAQAGDTAPAPKAEKKGKGHKGHKADKNKAGATAPEAKGGEGKPEVAKEPAPVPAPAAK